MNHLITELIETLKEDERLVIDNKLAKNKVVEFALALDEKLIELLLRNETLKKQFFKEVSNVMVFDKVTFQSFVSNKQFLPDSYTAFKNKIGLTANNEYLTESNEVVLSWPYKDCVLEGGQTKEDQKRKEVFWNETLAPDEIDRLLEPKTLTNFKKYDQDGKHKVENINLDDNLIIKGNNLLTLHSLKKQYAGKVKLIYVDPPYNTGNDDFRYNDSFNRSTWLTFIKNRFEISKILLSEDGAIYVSIDQNEIGSLLMLMDEVFGSNNRKNIITVKRSSVSGAKVINPGVVNISEYILIYTKNSNLWKPNKTFKEKEWDKRYNNFVINYEEDPSKWKYMTVLEAFSDSLGLSKKDLRKTLKEEYEFKLKEFVFANSQKVIQFAYLDENSVSAAAKDIKKKSKSDKSKTYVLKRDGKSDYFIHKGKVLLFMESRLINIEGKKVFGEMVSDIWDDVLPNDIHNEGGITLRKGKKPEKLIARILELGSNENDLVMDFFVGSGTTGAVAHKMKRKYVICEQLEYTEELPLKRLINTINGEQSGISKQFNWQGGGSFSYCELMKNNANIIDQIEEAETTKDLVLIWQNIKDNDFVSYKVKPSSINEDVHEFEALSIDDQKQFLIAVLDKNQLYVNYSEINDEDYQVSASDKELNKQFYGK